MTTETTAQKLGRIVLGSLMTLAGLGHLSFGREEFRAQVKFVRAGIDANPMTASQYGVGLLPSLVVVWRGRVVEMRDGLMDQASMRRLFELAAQLPDAPA